ncbi:MAG: hypothetical protein HQ541_11360 [Mariniphaga sp.]|nr:hypothetical protein [Mariniphaga sp.]
MKKWIHPKTKTGDAVTGEYYLRRQKINDLFWSYIEKRSDVLFVAPRRIGKSSIMKDLVASAPKNYYCIYKNIEGATTKNLFYKRIFEMLIQRLSWTKKNIAFVTSWISKYDIKKIGKDSIELGKSPKVYQKEVFGLLNEVAKEGLIVILFIDEFVEVILNLRNKGNTEDAISILHELREIRHNSDLKNIIFVYAGSIGLHYIVKEIGRPKLINDLEPLNIDPLTIPEAKQLINRLTKGATIQYDKKNQEYLINKIEHLIPYFIQLMIAEINVIAFKNDSENINTDLIDIAFTSATKNTANFDDWVKRLKDYLKTNYSFINHILTYCAHKGKINIQEIYDSAVEYEKNENYKELIDELVKDGYLYEKNNVYQFLSPFIKNYWLYKNPILK